MEERGERAQVIDDLAEGASTQPVLFRIPTQGRLLRYSPFEGETLPEEMRVTSEQVQTAFDPLKLADSVDFIPVHMEVHQASNARGEIPARICLLGKDRSACKLFVLPDRWLSSVSETRMEEASGGN